LFVFHLTFASESPSLFVSRPILLVALQQHFQGREREREQVQQLLQMPFVLQAPHSLSIRPRINPFCLATGSTAEPLITFGAIQHNQCKQGGHLATVLVHAYSIRRKASVAKRPKKCLSLAPDQFKYEFNSFKLTGNESKVSQTTEAFVGEK
jgi:hypothetical protein